MSRKTKITLTKESALINMLCLVEIGFKGSERGWNLEQTLDTARHSIKELVEKCDNLPSEILSIKVRQ